MCQDKGVMLRKAAYPGAQYDVFCKGYGLCYKKLRGGDVFPAGREMLSYPGL